MLTLSLWRDKMNVKSHAATPAASQVCHSSSGVGSGIKSPMRQSRRSEPCETPAEPCETIEEHLKRLYPTEYTKILVNATKDAGPEHTAQLLGYYAKGVYAKPLEVMFLWANTPEGYAYWRTLSQ